MPMATSGAGRSRSLSHAPDSLSRTSLHGPPPTTTTTGSSSSLPSAQSADAPAFVYSDDKVALGAAQQQTVASPPWASTPASTTASVDAAQQQATTTTMMMHDSLDGGAAPGGARHVRAATDPYAPPSYTLHPQAHLPPSPPHHNHLAASASASSSPRFWGPYPQQQAYGQDRGAPTDDGDDGSASTRLENANGELGSGPAAFAAEAGTARDEGRASASAAKAEAEAEAKYTSQLVRRHHTLSTSSSRLNRLEREKARAALRNIGMNKDDQECVLLLCPRCSSASMPDAHVPAIRYAQVLRPFVARRRRPGCLVRPWPSFHRGHLGPSRRCDHCRRRRRRRRSSSSCSRRFSHRSGKRSRESWRRRAT